MTPIRSPYPSTLSMLEDQRGTAVARSIAGVAMVAATLVLVAVSTHDIRPDSAVARSPNTAAGGHAPAAAAGAEPNLLRSQLDVQLRLDPRELAGYRFNVHG